MNAYVRTRVLLGQFPSAYYRDQDYSDLNLLYKFISSDLNRQLYLSIIRTYN